MKQLFFSFAKKGSILFSVSLMIGMSAYALVPSVPLTIEKAVLNKANLSGTFVIQTLDSMSLSPMIGVSNDAAVLGLPGSNFAMDLVKATDSTYFIQYGDKKANYIHGWNMGFDTITTDKNDWKINVLNGDTITLQRARENKFLKYEKTGDPSITRFYSDAGAPSKLILRNVTSKRALNLPEASKYTLSSVALNANDFSGKYLIQSSTGNFMTTKLASTGDLSIVAESDSAYAMDFVKQADGTYTISCGDMMANNMHPWLLRFDPLSTIWNKWTITLVEGNKVTIQRARDAKFVKNELNGPEGSNVYKYYTDAANNADVNYFLKTVTGIVSNKRLLTDSVTVAQDFYNQTTNATYNSFARVRYQDAIQVANSVLSNAFATQVQVDAALVALTTATRNFKYAKIVANRKPQVPLTLEKAVLNNTDLSGTFVIQTLDSMSMSPMIGVSNDAAVLGLPGTNFAMDVVRATDSTYYIQYGDKKANYIHGWNMGFDTITTDKNDWKINVLNGDTITLQRARENKFLKYEKTGGPSITRFYSDAGAPTKLIFRKVATMRPLLVPEAGKYTMDSVVLNANDFSGKYLIKSSTGHFMTTTMATTSDISVVATSDSAYAMDLAKQADGTYTITCGDMMANNMHPWLLRFDQLSTIWNTWTIQLVEGNVVTIQRARDAKYLKNELNGPVDAKVYKYYTDAANNADVKYSLQTVTGIATDKLALTDSLTKAQALHDQSSDAAYQANARSTYQAAILAAKSVKDNSYVTQAQVDAALSALNTATETFRSSKLVTDVYGNQTAKAVLAKNPVNDVLTVLNASNVSQIAVYSILGQQVYAQKTNSDVITISVKEWQSGLYLMKLTDLNGQSETLKLKVN